MRCLRSNYKRLSLISREAIMNSYLLVTFLWLSLTVTATASQAPPQRRSHCPRESFELRIRRPCGAAARRTLERIMPLDLLKCNVLRACFSEPALAPDSPPKTVGFSLAPYATAAAKLVNRSSIAPQAVHVHAP